MYLPRLMIGLMLATGAAHAAPAASPPPLAALDASAPAPKLAYDSAFADYKTDADAKVANWKETNAAIARAPGHGHAGHAGHDMSKMKAEPEGKPAAAKPAADPHAGHQH